jgi:hypothetical protein
LQKKQAFEMTPPKERHQTDREWVGGATPHAQQAPNQGGIPGINEALYMKTAGIAIAGHFWYNKPSTRKKVT